MTRAYNFISLLLQTGEEDLTSIKSRSRILVLSDNKVVIPTELRKKQLLNYEIENTSVLHCALRLHCTTNTVCPMKNRRHCCHRERGMYFASLEPFWLHEKDDFKDDRYCFSQVQNLIRIRWFFSSPSPSPSSPPLLKKMS